jgi:hypothetical protein
MKSAAVRASFSIRRGMRVVAASGCRPEPGRTHVSTGSIDQSVGGAANVLGVFAQLPAFPDHFLGRRTQFVELSRHPFVIPDHGSRVPCGRTGVRARDSAHPARHGVVRAPRNWLALPPVSAADGFGAADIDTG